MAAFPKAWKIAEVIPILKEGNSEEPANNRPISLLPILSKVSERLAHMQFVEFLTMHDKLSTYRCKVATGKCIRQKLPSSLLQTTF